MRIRDIHEHVGFDLLPHLTGERKARLEEAVASAVYGWRYRSVTLLAPPAVVVPFTFTSSQIAVADLLP